MKRDIGCKGIRLTSRRVLDIVKTFECGQCFRWNADERGVYTGVVKGCAASVWTEGDDVMISASEKARLGFWRDYFDLDCDYESLRRNITQNEYLNLCAEYGGGIRILRQDGWEALCSFIVSQCNNIPRIKKIIETFCNLFGDTIEHDGKLLYTFPDARRVSALSPDDLAPLRCGYRAPYITGAAKAVSSGELDLDLLAHGGYENALRSLRAISGIGDKVANCVILYGLHMMEAFPVDVWMRRAIKENLSEGFDPKALGECAGLCQQYIFYYARSNRS